MTSKPDFEAILLQEIRENGPFTLADYMARVLLDPYHGYYRRDQVFGAKGDFTTAPEISQMFGEILGLALLERWQSAGKPEPVRLIEFGPGRGTLMADIIRATRIDPSFKPSIHFVEASEARMAEQLAAVPDGQHHTGLDDIPEGYSLIVANEFFDALPIRQFQFDRGSWRERVVGEYEGKLALGVGPPIDLPAWALLPRGEIPQGAVTELSEPSLEYAHMIGQRLSAQGGVALLIDYGFNEPQFGSTFQAVKAHKKVSPFREPGTADVTALVNFANLARIFKQLSLSVYGPMEQGEYLMNMGIGERAIQLSRSGGATNSLDILGALKRLTAPEAMGSLFKVMMITSSDDVPAAFLPQQDGQQS